MAEQQPQSQSPKPPVPLPPLERVPNEKESLLSDTETAFNVSQAASGEVGTIVTDKRRTRPSFFGVIKEAATEWTEENTEHVKALEVFKKPDIPKVVPGTDRKDIIEKAVSTPQGETQDDHEVVIERIKTFKTDAERVTGRPFVLKKDNAGKPKGWSHIIGKEEPQKELPSSGKNFPEVQHIHREDVTSQAHNQSIAPIVTTRTTVSFESNETPVPPQPIPATPTPPPTPRPTPVPTPVPQPPEPVHVAEPEPIEQIPQPQPRRVSIPTPVPEPEPVLRERSGNGVMIAVVSLIIILVLGGIGGGVYYFMNREPVVAGVVVPTFMNADEKVPLPLSNDRTTLLQSLTSAIDTNDAEYLHVYFVFNDENTETETLATTQDFFGVLAPRTSSAFIRSLDERMMIGGVHTTETEPYMLLKSNTFDVAFAGMLEWESFISADLAPFFGEPIARSFDPTARSSDRTTALAFVDKTIANHNVRVLYDAEGNERITYGFVNRNTIILTSTGAAFEKILGALQ